MNEALKFIQDLSSELSKLDKTIVTNIKLNFEDIKNKIKKEIEEDLKREMLGRTSYGGGV